MQSLIDINYKYKFCYHLFKYNKILINLLNNKFSVIHINQSIHNLIEIKIELKIVNENFRA